MAPVMVSLRSLIVFEKHMFPHQRIVMQSTIPWSIDYLQSRLIGDDYNESGDRSIAIK